MAKKLEPLGSRILIKPVKIQEKTKSGLFLPDLVKEVPQEGTVIAVGPGRRNDKGLRIPVEIKTGDHVIYAKFSGTQYQDEAQDYYLIDDSQILAKLE
ncbi:MAG: co-chaperone GroES [Dehalococcoidia bacterium]|nr:co-chaperone GroES [Dehalococcoidia bacterium]